MMLGKMFRKAQRIMSAASGVRDIPCGPSPIADWNIAPEIRAIIQQSIARVKAEEEARATTKREVAKLQDKDRSIAAEIRVAIQRAIARLEAEGQKPQTQVFGPPPAAQPWALTITRLDNGFLLAGTNGAEKTTLVLKEEGKEEHKRAMMKMLLYVCSWLESEDQDVGVSHLTIHWSDGT